MLRVEDLIERLESVRRELRVALTHELKLVNQSKQALNDALNATIAAAKAANDVVNCKNANELAYLKLQSSEKAHYARLFGALSRDAAELASQAKQENARILLEIKKIAELLTIVLTEEQESHFSFGSESAG
jgi:hypothetical protein